MQTAPLTYRRATENDRDLLLAWRNDPATRAASLFAKTVGLAEHERWLTATLCDPARALFVFEEDDTAVGTVRADFEDGAATLPAWTVAPEARGRGIGRRMLALFRGT